MYTSLIYSAVYIYAPANPHAFYIALENEASDLYITEGQLNTEEREENSRAAMNSRR